jgi:hypothetical protein
MTAGLVLAKSKVKYKLAFNRNEQWCNSTNIKDVANEKALHTVGTLWMWIGDLLALPAKTRIRLLEFMTDLTNVQFNHKF